MAINVFETILKEKIDTFIYQYRTSSRRQFYDPSKGKLIHPGEFGILRENIIKEFLRYVVPQKYSFGTGFLISTYDDVSTQCDVVIYDAQNTPLVENTERQRFFPVETVVAVGEVKSILNKQQLFEAVFKLSKVKALRERIKNPIITFRSDNGRIYSPSDYHYDQVFTFLVCERFDFKTDELIEEIDGAYADMPVRMKHNMILSMDDGLLLYYDINGKTMMYPFHNGRQLKNRLVMNGENPYSALKLFSSYMFLGTSSTTILYPEMSDYIGTILGGKNLNQV